MNLVPDTSPHSTLRQHFRDLGYSWSWTKLCRNMVSWVQWPYRRILKIFRFVTVAVIQWSFYPRYFLPYVLVFCGSSILDCWTRPNRKLLGTEREKPQKIYGVQLPIFENACRSALLRDSENFIWFKLISCPEVSFFRSKLGIRNRFFLFDLYSLDLDSCQLLSHLGCDRWIRVVYGYL